MKLRKTTSAFLLILFNVQLLGFIYPQTQKMLPTVKATSTSDAYIFKDGDFYYFNSSEAGFYFRFHYSSLGLGFTVRSHSNYEYNLACEKEYYAPLYWEYKDIISGESKSNEGGMITVLRNASDFSLVKIHCPQKKMNHTIYYGFWRDKPYVWTYLSRTVNEDMIAWNSQLCHMWSRNMTCFWYTNYTGQIVNYNYTTGSDVKWSSNPMFSALDNGTMMRYPLMAQYNETIDVTTGEIYTYATPNIRKDLRLWGFEIGRDFIETQVDFTTNEDPTVYWKQGKVMGLEWLFFIKSGSPFSSGNIADYSEQLYNNATDNWVDIENDFWSAVQLHDGASNQPCGVRGYTPYVASAYGKEPRTYFIPYMFLTSPCNFWTDMPYDIPINSKWLFRRNTTDEIELDYERTAGTSYGNISEVNYMIGSVSWDKGNVTAHSHVKAFGNSDKLIFYGNATLDVDSIALNSSFNLYFNRITDCVQISSTEYDLRWEDYIFGWVGIYVKINAGTAVKRSDMLQIILFNNTSPEPYVAGQSWSYNFTLYGHTGNASSMTTFFDLSPLKYKTLWFNYALGNNAFGFQSMREYCVINATYSSNILTTYLFDTTSGNKNVEIFIKDKGKPTIVQVDGQSTNFDYNNVTKIVTFTITFSNSAKKIMVCWDVNLWQMTWNWKDMDNNDVSSIISWKLYSGSQELTYTQGQYTLLDGTYTLETYYHSVMINHTDLPTTSYGNKTTSIYLTMKSHESKPTGYIVLNVTATITIISQTSANLTATMSGSGPAKMIWDLPKKPSYFQKDDVNQTGWTYSDYILIYETSNVTGKWEAIFGESSVPSPHTWWDVISNYLYVGFITLILFYLLYRKWQARTRKEKAQERIKLKEINTLE